MTIEDRLYKFLILRKSSSYWVWGFWGEEFVLVLLFLLRVWQNKSGFGNPAMKLFYDEHHHNFILLVDLVNSSFPVELSAMT